jgi:hypothetical protein
VLIQERVPRLAAAIRNQPAGNCGCGFAGASGTNATNAESNVRYHHL